MVRCSTCGTPMRGDAAKIGARCPTCREAIYEPPRDPHQPAADGSQCALHPENGTVGTCQRCGNYLCSICWSRWHDRAVCARCVDHALEGSEASPRETRAHLRQALLGVVFGVLAWLVTLAAFLLIAVGFVNDDDPIRMQMLVGFGVIVMLGSPFPAVLGVGQAAAAIRARGDHMVMATIGLLLSGMHAGLIVGLFMFSVWDS